MPAIIEENWPQLCQAQPVLCPHYCKNQRKTPLMLATCALPIPETKTPYKYRPTLDLAFDSGRASGDPCRSPEIDRPVAYDIERRSLNPFCLSEPAGRVRREVQRPPATRDASPRKWSQNLATACCATLESRKRPR